MTKHLGGAAAPDVFISYASRNRDRIVKLAGHLEAAGVTIWRDQNEILGGENYGPKIVHGVENCKVLLLACTDASMRSKNVKQEIQLAWSFDRPYLPLLVEPMDKYPHQIRYWLEGCQWIEVLNRAPEQWLPRVVQALTNAGVKTNFKTPSGPKTGADGWLSLLGRLLGRKSLESKTNVATEPTIQLTQATQGLEGLRSLARFTDQIWPVSADRVHRGATRSGLRDLGAPQDDVQHGHRLGSRVCLAIESDRSGHLLLLDEGATGKIYCLCPSAFAPDTRLAAGRTYLPQHGSRYNSFEVSGMPGRENLLAIVTEDPLELDWMPRDEQVPARVLNSEDVDALLARLRALEADRWTALGTYFDVIE